MARRITHNFKETLPPAESDLAAQAFKDPYLFDFLGTADPLLLCRTRNKLVVEYALRNMEKPIGVAGWETRLVEELPEELKGSLPTVAEIEAELGG